MKQKQTPKPSEPMSPVNVDQNRAAGQHSPALGSRQGRAHAQGDQDVPGTTPEIGTNAAQIVEAGEPLPKSRNA
ncbi:MAG: hypothetical protein EOO27_22550 [Comamonadaceae bacterium]|nr:MAG: hypothetical protein EOO27_22550 [Comamonadaceae bacterium]